MTATRLIEKEAWLEIRLAYKTPFEQRTVGQHELTALGCCHAIHCMQPLSEDIYRSMRAEIQERNKVVSYTTIPEYFYPCRTGRGSVDFKPEHDKLRADFCYLMALSCEEK